MILLMIIKRNSKKLFTNEESLYDPSEMLT